MEERAEPPDAKKPRFMQNNSEGKIFPRELLLHIFSFLPKTDLVHTAGLVCKYWKELSLDHSLWHEITLTWPGVRDGLGPRLIGGMIQLKKLKVVRLYDDEIDGILEAVCPKLEELHLEYMTFHEEPLSRLASKCKNLKQVYIRHCNMEGDCRHFLDIFAECKNLQSISLVETSGSRPLDTSIVRNWQGLKEVFTATHLPSADAEVKVLTATVGAQIVKFTAKKLMVPRSYTRVGQFAKLQELHLITNCCMTNSCLLNGLSHLKNLRALTLRNAMYIATEVMVTFLRLSDTCKSLQVLDLYNNQSVDNTCLSAIATTCPHLTYLNVGGCDRITLNGLINLITSCKDLQVLDVTFCNLDLEYYELYKEALYTAMAAVGLPSKQYPYDKIDLIAYTRLAFRMPLTNHESLMRKLTEEFAAQPPIPILNVIVEEGKNLKGKKVKDTGNPYCLVHVVAPVDEPIVLIGLKTRKKPTCKGEEDTPRPFSPRDKIPQQQRYRKLSADVKTTVRRGSVHPVWGEKFQVPVLRPKYDMLHIEVWDHTSKGSRTSTTINLFMRWFDTLAKCCQPRSRSDKFLGKTTLKIKDVPAEGMEKWYGLLDKLGNPNSGSLCLRMYFTIMNRRGQKRMDKEKANAILTDMQNTMLAEEASVYKDNAKEVTKWPGNLSLLGQALLYQFSLQVGLIEPKREMAQDQSFLNLEVMQKSQYSALLLTAENLHKAILKECSAEEKARIGSSLQKMCQEHLPYLRQVWVKFPYNDKGKVSDLRKLLAFFSTSNLVFCCIGPEGEAIIKDLKSTISDQLRAGFLSWYDKFVGNMTLDPKDPSTLVANLVTIMKEINNIVLQASEVYHALFIFHLKLDYLCLLYKEAQMIIQRDIKTNVSNICHVLEGHRQKVKGKLSQNDMNISRDMYQLYILMQQFAEFPRKLHSDLALWPDVQNYHCWFQEHVPFWMQYALALAKTQVRKAIELDDKERVEDTLITTSALDTVCCFYRLKRFYVNLRWPNAIQAFGILKCFSNLIASVAREYAEKRVALLEKEGLFLPTAPQLLDVTSDSVCVALNNIEWVKNSVDMTLDSMEVEDLLQTISKSMNPAIAEACKKEIDEERESGVQALESTLNMLFQRIGLVMRDDITDLVDETIDLLLQGNKLMEATLPLMDYLEYCLVKFLDTLSSLNFLRMAVTIWDVLEMQLYVCSIFRFQEEKLHPYTFYLTRSLEPLQKHLYSYFHGDGKGVKDEKLSHIYAYEKMEELLKCIRMTTDDLIEMFYTNLKQRQKLIQDNLSERILQIKVWYCNGILNIIVFEVLGLESAKNCYSTIKLIPRKYFQQLKVGKTGTCSSTITGEFKNGCFQYAISRSSLQLPTTALLVSVFSDSGFMGECILPFKDLTGIVYDLGPSEKDVPIIREHLSFGAEDDLIDPCFIALQSRRLEDPIAVRFVEDRQQRIVPLQ